MTKAEKVFNKFQKRASLTGAATVGVIGLSLAPRPRQKVTSIADAKGKNIALRKLINLKQKR